MIIHPKQDRIRELKEEISELKARLPAHSVPPRMLQQLEDMEDELEQLLIENNTEND